MHLTTMQSDQAEKQLIGEWTNNFQSALQLAIRQSDVIT